jgi:hypothetical protein
MEYEDMRSYTRILFKEQEDNRQARKAADARLMVVNNEN